MESSRRDLWSDMAEHRRILENNQNTYQPRFGFTPHSPKRGFVFNVHPVEWSKCVATKGTHNQIVPKSIEPDDIAVKSAISQIPVGLLLISDSCHSFSLNKVPLPEVVGGLH